MMQHLLPTGARGEILPAEQETVVADMVTCNRNVKLGEFWGQKVLADTKTDTTSANVESGVVSELRKRIGMNPVCCSHIFPIGTLTTNNRFSGFYFEGHTSELETQCLQLSSDLLQQKDVKRSYDEIKHM